MHVSRPVKGRFFNYPPAKFSGGFTVNSDLKKSTLPDYVFTGITTVQGQKNVEAVIPQQEGGRTKYHFPPLKLKLKN